MPQRGLKIVVRVELAEERGAQRGGHPGVVSLLGHGLVGDQRRLNDDPGRRLERLDLIADRGHRALNEGDEPGRVDLDRLARRRNPVRLTPQDAVA